VTAKPWAGRFEKATDKLVEAFTQSISFDQRLARFDICGSMAHAAMLGRQGVIPAEDAAAIVRGLAQVWAGIAAGAVPLDPALEDIHMAVETKLGKQIGPTAGKLHTARSRNDQVATGLRLFAKDAIAQATRSLSVLQATLADLAEAHQSTLFPGYTHVQRAQPVTLAHHFLAYFEMFDRDRDRLADCFRRTGVLPLGSGALAGAPYPLDRAWVAQRLGFAQVSANSIDAVADRDFVIEFEAAAALCMVHLSRLAEELVLWSSQEFGFIDLDDGFATGSSIMPQKKNPDVAELVRGKAGPVFGNLMAMLTLMKGLPLAYNRDMQEDKPGFFACVDTLQACLDVMSPMLASMTVRTEAIRKAVDAGYALATDLADYLVAKALPFREAHHVVGSLVGYCVAQGKTFPDLTLQEYQQFSPLFEADVFDITVERSLAARDVPGGTAPRQVALALAAARRRLAEQPILSVPPFDPATFATTLG
jgi:argininosuccinate lyase